MEARTPESEAKRRATNPAAASLDGATTSPSDQGHKAAADTAVEASPRIPKGVVLFPPTDTAEADMAPLAEDAEPEEEAWELAHVLSAEDVYSPDAVKCHTKGCRRKAAVVYRVVGGTDADNDDAWYTCIDCQDADFGGWPGDDELRKFVITAEQEQAFRERCCLAKTRRSAIMPSDRVFPDTPSKIVSDKSNCGTNQAPGGNDDGEDGTPSPHGQHNGEPTWDLVKVLDEAQIKGPYPIACYTETCLLKAAVVYVSSDAPDEKWYSCLDCQESDFGGWPDEDDMRGHSITVSHAAVLRKHCSSDPLVEVPVVQSSSLTMPEPKITNITTPVPTYPKKNGLAKNASHVVTPAVTDQDVNMPPGGTKVTSKAAIELHKKWQQQASKFDPNARLIVDKDKAKSLVFDALYDAFAPMNITQVHTAIKAVVPPPVLKAALEDMADDSKKKQGFFADSDPEDDEDDGASQKTTKKGKPSNAPGDSYKLLCKEGRTSAHTLYYVDYQATPNEGNGLPAAEKQDLVKATVHVESQKQALQRNIGLKVNESAKLLGEPTNDEIADLLDSKQAELNEWTEKATQARGYQANVKHKESIKRRVRHMTGEWRKRRRVCLDFLTNMEEMTEGTVTRSKCLAGDDKHIEIESDEVAAQNALAFHQKKQMQRLKKAKLAPADSSSRFVAVRLNSQGCVERIFAE